MNILEIKIEHYNIMNCYNDSNIEEIEKYLKENMLFNIRYVFTPDGDIEYVYLTIYNKIKKNYKELFLNVFEIYGGVYYIDYEELCNDEKVEKEDFKEKTFSIQEISEKIKNLKRLEYNDYDTFVELYNGLLEYEDINLLKKIEKETKIIGHYYNLAKESIEKNYNYIFKIDKETMEELEKINLKGLSEKEQENIIYSIKLLTIKMFNDNYINIFELEQKSIKINKEMEKFEGENEEKAFQDFKESIIEKIFNAPQEEINKFKNKLNLKSDEEILKELYKYYLISRKRIKKERKKESKLI